MKLIKITYGTVVLAAVFAATVPALAQTRKPDGDDLAKRFAAADKDGDGRLTLEEAKAGAPLVAKNFERVDKDKKGYVTIDEIKTLMPKR